MRFLLFEIRRVKRKQTRGKRRRETYRDWPIWKYIQKYHGFRNFSQARTYVILTELIEKLDEIRVLHKIEGTTPDYIV